MTLSFIGYFLFNLTESERLKSASPPPQLARLFFFKPCPSYLLFLVAVNYFCCYGAFYLHDSKLLQPGRSLIKTIPREN
jgi:hypothetical protein